MAAEVKTAIQTEIQIWGKMSAIEAQNYIKRLKVCSLLILITKLKIKIEHLFLVSTFRSFSKRYV